MMVKRHLLPCRLKATVIIFVLSFIFVSMGLTYRALTSQYDSKHYPSFGGYNGHKHLKPKFSELDILGQGYDHNKSLKKKHIDLSDGDIAKANDRMLLSLDSRKALIRFLEKLYPEMWSDPEDADIITFDLKYLLIENGLESNMTCQDIDRYQLGEAVSYSKTKIIESVYTNEQDKSGDNTNNAQMYYGGYQGLQNKKSHNTVIKSPSQDMERKQDCLKQKKDLEYCETLGNHRLLREIIFMSVLKHPSVLNLKGYCLRGSSRSTKLNERGIVMVIESGQPLTEAKIISYTVYQRIKIAAQMCRLLSYLSTSTLGSLRLSRLDLKDFVMVKDILKLADLDDLTLEQQGCQDISHCVFNGVERGPCQGGICRGYNTVNNLDLALPYLKLILKDVQAALVLTEKVMELGLEGMVKELMKMAGIAKVKEQAMKIPNVHMMGVDDADNNRIKPLEKSRLLGGNSESQFKNFQRIEGGNSPGQFDYSCPGSRVSWGCVFTVKSLEKAMQKCVDDTQCLSFVTFSPKPEEERLMTVVFKNSWGFIQKGAGTTLFILDRNLQYSKLESQEVLKLTDTGTEANSCLDSNAGPKTSDLKKREKRLMSHLGLKGTTEESWLSAMKSQTPHLPAKIESAPTKGDVVSGGKCQVNFTESEDPQVKKATFILENGPLAYHAGYALLYNLDRTLGLYHVPPCVGVTMQNDTVARFMGNAYFQDAFNSLTQEGQLKGVMVPVTPKVMKGPKLSVRPFAGVDKEHSRTQRMQLEYVWLWWLGRVALRTDGHLGYKGHMIHFDADKSFINSSVDMSDYLSHCQFPESLFSALKCFRCKDSNVVCNLGQEVIKRTRTTLTSHLELFINNNTEGMLINLINNAATQLLEGILDCLEDSFTEDVLY